MEEDAVSKEQLGLDKKLQAYAAAGRLSIRCTNHGVPEGLRQIIQSGWAIWSEEDTALTHTIRPRVPLIEGRCVQADCPVCLKEGKKMTYFVELEREQGDEIPR
ncbi:MAG: hypothetical protein HY377_00800 [Candidatus Blackburnbacteria bacterium]|nr:hypothetical protein [Candidatus Blackburnbacteria bacterium]